MMTGRLTRRVMGVVVFAALSACGGSDPIGPASGRNDPGTGSGTFKVTAGVEVEDEGGSGYTTQILVSVRNQAGAPISGASVRVTAAGIGAVILSETAVGTGDYAVTRSGAAVGDVRLDVLRGSDNVTNVIVGSPGLHTITAPTSGGTVTSAQALTIRWTVPRPATRVEIETHDVEVSNLSDNGVHVLPGASNPARATQRIRVYRINEVTITGGLTGSRLRISVRDTVEPIVVQ